MTDYCGPLIKQSAGSKESKRIQETHESLDTSENSSAGKALIVFT